MDKLTGIDTWTRTIHLFVLVFPAMHQKIHWIPYIWSTIENESFYYFVRTLHNLEKISILFIDILVSSSFHGLNLCRCLSCSQLLGNDKAYKQTSLFIFQQILSVFLQSEMSKNP